MLRILKKMDLGHKRWNDGRKFLRVQSDTVVLMAVFLHKMQKSRQNGRACIYYLDDTWVNQNHTRETCWKMSDGSVGLRVPVCHAGSAATRFSPERKLIFRSKSKALIYYHNEITYETFKKWSAEQFLLYISPEFIVMVKASTCSVMMEKPPCKDMMKADIIARLSSRNIPHTASQTNSKLL
jgi:hypothetical protein